MHSIPRPALFHPSRLRRAISWKAVLTSALVTLVWFVLQQGFFPDTKGWLSNRAEAAQNNNLSPATYAAAAEEDSSPQQTDQPSKQDDGTDAAHAAGHRDPVAEVLLAISIILLLAKTSGDLFERVGMPAVLGELSVGILLGNWQLITGSEVFEFFKPHPEDASAMTGNVLDMLSRIGVVLLLFEVGLESRVKEMVAVGTSSLLVAVIGVIVPMALGFGIGFLLLSEDATDWQVPAFLGATLCATSVGITARVLKDIGKNRTRESSIILGAAVIDDVLGLVILAVVSGVIMEGDRFEVMTLFRIVGLSLAFLASALILGALQFPRLLFTAASFLRGHGLLVTTALLICFFFAWAANHLAGLATIIGAFAAGLILEGAHYQEVGNKWKNQHLENALAPLTALLVPIFFVATGISVDLSKFSGRDTWILAIGLIGTAVIGKLVCSFGVRESGVNRLAVGLGMIPRGEVGLIFAGEGKRLTTPDGLAVIDEGTFSAIVVMVMITTMITPPLLKWSLGRHGTDTSQDKEQNSSGATESEGHTNSS